MFGARVLIGLAAAVALGGCARSRGNHEVARLQSQVGMLDERVTQLERSSIGGMASTPIASPSPDFGSPLSAPPSVAVSASPAAAASTKATTREIQQALKNAGFYQGAVDGKLGPQSRSAIKEFQRVHGLKDDGVVGKQTWAKLQPYLDLSGDVAVK